MAIEAVVYAVMVNGKVKERHQQMETAKRMAIAINASGGKATVDRVVTINGKAERKQVWPRLQIKP